MNETLLLRIRHYDDEGELVRTEVREDSVPALDLTADRIVGPVEVGGPGVG